MKKIKTEKSKKILLISSVVVALVVAGGVFAYFRNNGKNSENDTPVVVEDSNKEEPINYGPPTDEEKNAGEAIKEQHANNPDEEEPDTQKKVKPEIINHGVYDDNVEVSSSVPGIYEKSGKCTLKLTKNGKTVSQTKDATQNVSEMSCGLISIPTSKLSSGTWSAVVTYSSAKAQGISDKVSIQVK